MRMIYGEWGFRTLSEGFFESFRLVCFTLTWGGELRPKIPDIPQS